MKVVKKNGKLENFNKEKICISIYNASCDVEYGLLNTADLKILLEDIVNTLQGLRKNNEQTSSYEIFGVIINSLKKNGFHNVVKAYSSL